MNGALVDALWRELASESLFDEGIEAARNACVAGASVVAAAITAAAYYDSPVVGIRALTECMRRLSALPLEPVAWQAAFARAAGADVELAPGFGYVGETQASAVLQAAEHLTRDDTLLEPPARVRFWLARRSSLEPAIGPLNAVGLAALAFTDAAVPAAVAERTFLGWRIATAMEEAAAARERGLRAFPFFMREYRYEGASPPERSFDRARLMQQIGLSSPATSPASASSDATPAAVDDTASLQTDIAARDETPGSPELHASAGIVHLGRQVIVHGRDLHHECLGMSFVHYFLFCVTGRWFDAERARVLERLWLCSAYPDARIWCNRIAGYMGSARVDPGLTISAAMAASNSEEYGFRALSQAFRLQHAMPDALADRERWLAEMLAERRLLHGYGRPLQRRDERIAAALFVLADARMPAGPALQRAFWLDAELTARRGIGMNIAAFWAAVALDFGLDQLEFEAFMLLMFAPGYAAVYADQRKRSCLSFLHGHQTRVRPTSA
jgi:citrate synthase